MGNAFPKESSPIIKNVFSRCHEKRRNQLITKAANFPDKAIISHPAMRLPSSEPALVVARVCEERPHILLRDLIGAHLTECFKL